MTLDSRNGNEIKQSCSLLGLKKVNGRNILGFEIKKSLYGRKLHWQQRKKKKKRYVSLKKYLKTFYKLIRFLLNIGCLKKPVYKKEILLKPQDNFAYRLECCIGFLLHHTRQKYP